MAIATKKAPRSGSRRPFAALAVARRPVLDIARRVARRRARQDSPPRARRRAPGGATRTGRRACSAGPGRRAAASVTPDRRAAGGRRPPAPEPRGFQGRAVARRGAPREPSRRLPSRPGAYRFPAAGEPSRLRQLSGAVASRLVRSATAPGPRTERSRPCERLVSCRASRPTARESRPGPWTRAGGGGFPPSGGHGGDAGGNQRCPRTRSPRRTARRPAVERSAAPKTQLFSCIRSPPSYIDDDAWRARRPRLGGETRHTEEGG